MSIGTLLGMKARRETRRKWDPHDHAGLRVVVGDLAYVFNDRTRVLNLQKTYRAGPKKLTDSDRLHVSVLFDQVIEAVGRALTDNEGWAVITYYRVAHHTIPNAWFFGAIISAAGNLESIEVAD